MDLNDKEYIRKKNKNQSRFKSCKYLALTLVLLQMLLFLMSATIFLKDYQLFV